MASQESTQRIVKQNPSYNYCALPLTAYATNPEESRGRLHEEDASQSRTCFQRDRDRIIHCSAFRRLKYKTQVFVYHQGDHYRTRLSHTLEVSQIARSLARALLVNEDLAETIALAHDLGHTPFAHIGEIYLQECMSDFGGFDHNDQSLRVLTVLEHKYPRWIGLNMTIETLAGVIKHNGPITDTSLPYTLNAFQKDNKFDLSVYASVEAQIAALADDIAYNNHDVEDGLQAGMFTLEDLKTIPLMKDLIIKTRTTYPDISEKILVQEIIREMIGKMVRDVLDETERRIHDLGPQTIQDIVNHNAPVVQFSPEMFETVQMMRKFLYERMYRHYTVERIRLKVKTIIKDMFGVFLDDYKLLPDNWQRKVEDAGGIENDMNRARVVCDYIAGMTDRYAILEHERLFELHRWAK